MTLSLIDPPITPLSRSDDIEKWLTELRKMNSAEEDLSILTAIAHAKEMLEDARHRESSTASE